MYRYKYLKYKKKLALLEQRGGTVDYSVVLSKINSEIAETYNKIVERYTYHTQGNINKETLKQIENIFFEYKDLLIKLLFQQGGDPAKHIMFLKETDLELQKAFDSINEKYSYITINKYDRDRLKKTFAGIKTGILDEIKEIKNTTPSMVFTDELYVIFGETIDKIKDIVMGNIPDEKLWKNIQEKYYDVIDNTIKAIRVDADLYVVK